MARNYVNQAHTLGFTNGTGSDIASGQVVAVGNLLAVALEPIADGATGMLATSGRWIVPKVSGAVIAQGETLTWDASAAAFDDNAATPATGDITGAAAFAAQAAGNGVTSFEVVLTGAPGTRTA